MPRLLAAIVVTLLVGCVRGGFEPHASGSAADALGQRDRGGGRELSAPREAGGELGHDRGSPREAAVAPGPGATAANDSCASPFVVSMAGKSSLTIALDFAGAKHDQNILCCFGAPDLVVKVTDLPENVGVACSGGGTFQIVDSPSCPKDVASCFSGSCGPGNGYSLSPSSEGRFFVICRPGGGTISLVLTAL